MPFLKIERKASGTYLRITESYRDQEGKTRHRILQLYKIEQTFRSFKSHLETRPMFHWTDNRIEGHICLCYIAFTLQHWVLHKLKDFPIPMTEDILRQILDKMQLSSIQHNGQKVCLRSSPQPHEAKMQQLLGLKQLPPILPLQQLPTYI